MIGLLAVAFVGQSYVGQGYYQQYYQPNYNQAYVEKVVFVAVEDPANYYSGLVGSAQRSANREAQAQQLQANADAKIDRLTAVIEALQKRIEASEPPLPSHPGQQISSPPVPTPRNESEAVPPPPTVAQAASKKSNGLAVLSRACASCHTGRSTTGGGHQLFASDGRFTVQDREGLEAIEAAISSRRMPKGSRKLTVRETVAVINAIDEQTGNLALNTNPRKAAR